MNDSELQTVAHKLLDRELMVNISGIVNVMAGTDYEELSEMADGKFLSGFTVRYRIVELPDAGLYDDELDAEQDAYDAGLEDFHIEEVEEYREVYEHYIVSQWLGEKLAEQGEAVEFDFYGQVVWARGATGQSVILDNVIQRVAQEVFA